MSIETSPQANEFTPAITWQEVLDAHEELQLANAIARIAQAKFDRLHAAYTQQSRAETEQLATE